MTANTRQPAEGALPAVERPASPLHNPTMTAPYGKPLESFVAKHYVGDDYPSLKGNGFDGLRIGDSKDEAQAFVDFLNKHLGLTP